VDQSLPAVAGPGAAARTGKRVLDPIERLSEILFGLIMALTFTGSIHAASADREEVRTMLIGAIGCNIAWGVVDAVMYLMTDLIGRSRTTRTLIDIHTSRDPRRANALIVDALPEEVAAHIQPGEIDHVRGWIERLPDPSERTRLSPGAWGAAFGVFLLVTLSTFPMVVPFFFVSDHVLALRLSNAVALVSLFAIGYALARYAHLQPILTGLAMLGIGTVLVLLAIALGG
jgi:hypothetical protein